MIAEDLLVQMRYHYTRQEELLAQLSALNEENKEEIVTHNFDILKMHTNWTDSVAKRYIYERRVPCVKIAPGVYEFKASELRLWNLWGRPMQEEFYARLKAERKPEAIEQ